MKVVIVFDHPYGQNSGYNEPHNQSFTAALLVATVKSLTDQGKEVDIIDLNQDNFDPRMQRRDLVNWRTAPFVDVQTENYFTRLYDADEIIMLFPIWWEMMPAMTKGFLDKVLAKGQVKRSGKGAPRQMFPVNKPIRILTISGTPTWIYRLVYGNPIEKMLKRGVFGKLGMKNFKWHNFNAEDTNAAGRAKMLTTVGKYI